MWTFYNASGVAKTTLVPDYVTALPSSPADGQEVYYAADATNGVMWHLRYRSGSASTYKWEFVGGGQLNWMDGANASAALSTTFGNISTAQKITVPLAGDYEVMWSTTTLRADAQQATYIGIKVDTTDPTLDTAVGAAATAVYANSAANIWTTTSQVRRITGIGASKDLTLSYRAASGTPTTYRLATSMFVRPVRVI